LANTLKYIVGPFSSKRYVSGSGRGAWITLDVLVATLAAADAPRLVDPKTTPPPPPPVPPTVNDVASPVIPSAVDDRTVVATTEVASTFAERVDPATAATALEMAEVSATLELLVYDEPAVDPAVIPRVDSIDRSEDERELAPVVSTVVEAAAVAPTVVALVK
jgi:hypothetical protein